MAIPNITLSGLTSSNSDTTLAKAGDTVTVTITTDIDVTSTTVTFQSGSENVGGSVTYTGSFPGTSFTASYIIEASDTDGNVSVNCSATTAGGGSNTTSSISDSSSVQVDTTAPAVAALPPPTALP